MAVAAKGKQEQSERKHKTPSAACDVFLTKQSSEEEKKKKSRELLNTSNLTAHSSTNAFLMDELFMRGSLDCYAGQTQHSFAVSFARVLFLSPAIAAERKTTYRLSL